MSSFTLYSLPLKKVGVSTETAGNFNVFLKSLTRETCFSKTILTMSSPGYKPNFTNTSFVVLPEDHHTCFSSIQFNQLRLSWVAVHLTLC